MVLGVDETAIDAAIGIVDKRLAERPYLLGTDVTIADISMTSYLYYPVEEFGFDVAAERKNIGAWLARMKALPGWAFATVIVTG